jgi:hypothetical protein
VRKKSTIILDSASQSVILSNFYVSNKKNSRQKEKYRPPLFRKNRHGEKSGIFLMKDEIEKYSHLTTTASYE